MRRWRLENAWRTVGFPWGPLLIFAGYDAGMVVSSPLGCHHTIVLRYGLHMHSAWCQLVV